MSARPAARSPPPSHRRSRSSAGTACTSVGQRVDRAGCSRWRPCSAAACSSNAVRSSAGALSTVEPQPLEAGACSSCSTAARVAELSSGNLGQRVEAGRCAALPARRAACRPPAASALDVRPENADTVRSPCDRFARSTARSAIVQRVRRSRDPHLARGRRHDAANGARCATCRRRAGSVTRLPCRRRRATSASMPSDRMSGVAASSVDLVRAEVVCRRSHGPCRRSKVDAARSLHPLSDSGGAAPARARPSSPGDARRDARRGPRPRNPRARAAAARRSRRRACRPR